MKKIRKDVEKLGELVGLIQQKDEGDTIKVSEANSNLMGGRNSCQARNMSSSHIGNAVTSKIAKLKSELNISSLTMTIKKNATHTFQAKEHPPGTVGMNEADTNAECGVAGKNMIPLSYSSRLDDVFGFLASKGAVKDVPVVTAATAYTNSKTGVTYILLFHEFLFWG